MPTPRKLTDEQVIAARREYALGRMHLSEFKKRTVSVLAKKFGVSETAMYDALHYRSALDVDEKLETVPELIDWLEHDFDERWKNRKEISSV